MEELAGLGLLPPSLASEVRRVAAAPGGGGGGGGGDRGDGGGAAAARHVAALRSAELCAAMDAGDELRGFREEFCFPAHSQRQLAAARQAETGGEGSMNTTTSTGSSSSTNSSGGGAGDAACVYLCGNSLGLMPKRARVCVQEELDKWASLGVEGHFWDGANPWVSMNEVCLGDVAALVGAREEEVVSMSSLTVNLHLMMVSFYRPNKAKRFKLLLEAKAFPSDFMVARSHVLEKGLDPDECLVFARPRPGEELLRTEDVLALVDEHAAELALVLLPGVQYYTGQVLEMQRITTHCKQASGGEIKVGFDLAHAVGNVELELHDWGVDFACWCSYKYLNTGPGGVGGAFVHERYAAQDERALPRLQGWWGHRKEDRFLMAERFEPARGAFGWQLSNPAILPLATLRASMELFARATMPALRKKSLALTRYLELLLALELPAGQCSVISPPFSRHAERGAQLSLVFAGGNVKAVHAEVETHGVICDMREPDVMRIAPAPLYNSFRDVRQFVAILKAALAKVGEAA